MKPCNELEIVGLDATYRKYYLKGYEDAEKEHNYHLKKIRAEIAEYKDDKIIHAEQNEMIDIMLEIINKYTK